MHYLLSIPPGILGAVESYKHADNEGLGLLGALIRVGNGVLLYEIGRQIISDGIDCYKKKDIQISKF